MTIKLIWLKFVSMFTNDSNRTPFALRHVAIEENRMYASQGHYMGLIGKDLEDKPGMAHHVELKSVNKAIKQWPKRSKELEINEQNSSDTVVKFKSGPNYIEPMNSKSLKYPDISKVIPQSDPVYRLHFNPQYLLDVAKAFMDLEKKGAIGPQALTLELFHDFKTGQFLPAKFSAPLLNDEGDAEVFLMPGKPKGVKLGFLIDLPKRRPKLS